MAKRGNESGQMRREDYDAMESKGSAEPTGDFQRASDEQLKKRRIVQVSRRSSSGASRLSHEPTPPAAVTNSATSSTGNPFGSFSFAAGSSTVGSSTTPPAAATTESPKKANPFVNFSFGASSAATTSSNKAVMTSSSANISFGNSGGAGSSGSKNPQAKIPKLVKSLDNLLVDQNNLRCELAVPVQQFLTTFLHLAEKQKPKTVVSSTTTTTTSTSKKTNPSTGTVAPANTPLFGATSSAKPADSSASKPLFGNSSTSLFGQASSPAAAAPVPFSFSGSTPAASAPSASTTTQFSFSLSQTKAATPALSQSTTASATSGVSVGAPSASSPSKTPGDTNDDGEPATELESADQDWNIISTCTVKIYRTEGGKAVELCQGDIKLQKHKTGPSRRMVMRNIAGKVMFNMGINSNMSFSKKLIGKKYGGVTYMGLLAGDDKPHIFILKCGVANLDKLHQNLDALTKN